jgi:hypothetical protein
MKVDTAAAAHQANLSKLPAAVGPPADDGRRDRRQAGQAVRLGLLT